MRGEVSAKEERRGWKERGSGIKEEAVGAGGGGVEQRGAMRMRRK